MNHRLGGQSLPLPKSQRRITLSYTPAGDLASQTDALGQETLYTTDALGRPSGSTNPLGFTSAQQHNVLDQPTANIDALGQSSSLAYDSAGRLAGVVNPAGVTIEGYAYDSFGRLVRTTDALGLRPAHWPPESRHAR